MSHPLYDENPVNRFASNYGILEKIDWLRNRALTPTKRYRHLSSYLPEDTTLNEISPAFRIAFTGDIMPLGHRELSFDKHLEAFYADADFWVINLEGIIYPTERWLALSHKAQIIKSLRRYFPPERTLITCANNHTGDFGYRNFEHSYQMLKDAGYHVIGRKDENAFMLPNRIRLICATMWSNQICEYVPRLGDAHPDPEANFNILVYHWGYELHLYPNPKQIALAADLLKKYDALIGHHSHCPQPVTAMDKRLIAYSLGNFCAQLWQRNHRHGIALKMELGPDAGGAWKTGRVEYGFTRYTIHRNKVVEVGLVDEYRY